MTSKPLVVTIVQHINPNNPTTFDHYFSWQCDFNSAVLFSRSHFDSEKQAKYSAKRVIKSTLRRTHIAFTNHTSYNSERII